MLAPTLALTALALAAPTARPIAGPVAGLALGAHRAPDLALHLVDPGGGGDSALALEGTRRDGGAGAPVCSGDVCQPVVWVPGYEPSYDSRARRDELFLAFVTRAHLEPIATIAWALAATGLHFEYNPVNLDAPSSGGRGWGSALVRLRFRLDATNAPVLPRRPR